MNFLYPSKPSTIYDCSKLISTLRDLNKLENYRVQLKKNGCRAIVLIDENFVTIKNRQNTILTISLEKDWSPLAYIFPANTLLDGELIGRKQGEVSNRLYLWDVPICGGEDLTKVSYDERYQELNHLFKSCVRTSTVLYEQPEWTYAAFGAIQNQAATIIGVAKSYLAEAWEELLKSVNYISSTGENEGLVFKDITNHLSWDRFKTRDIKEQVKFLFKYMKK